MQIDAKSLVNEPSMAKRKREFNETYQEWIRAQAEHFEQRGLWCDGQVPWTQEPRQDPD